MTPSRWARIKEVFGAAYEQHAAERAHFLDSACDGDAEFRAEVERNQAEVSVHALVHSLAPDLNLFSGFQSRYSTLPQII